MEKDDKFDLNIIWKNSSKKYNLKKRDYMLWCQSHNLIFSIFSNLSIKNGEYYLNVHCEFKPMWADDIFWEITDPKSLFNFPKEPTSFRVMGADVAPMKKIYLNQVKLSSLNIEETQNKFDNEIEKILGMIDSINEKNYVTENEVSVINILNVINNKEYNKARKLLKKISSPFHIITGNLKKNNSGIGLWTFKLQARKFLRFKK